MSIGSQPAAAGSVRSPASTGGLREWLRVNRYAALSAVVLAVAAYLCLVNLDYAALWHDEAPTALIGRNLLERGDITGWDGRNLVGGTNGRTLNDDLRDVLPPLMYAVSAASFALFGVSETAARIMPALFGILALVLLYLLLREHLRGHPRLLFFSLLLAAWSPQLLLYFRQSRYYAFMALGLIAAFYLYERWWRSGRARFLAGLTVVSALAFFNHYGGGAATMLAVACWHLLFRRRATTERQWIALVACGAAVVVAGVVYLGWIGVTSGERVGFLAFTGVPIAGEYRGEIPPFVLRVATYGRDLFTADWISLPVFLWFAGMLWLTLVRPGHPFRPVREGRRASDASEPQPSPDRHAGELPVAAAARVVLQGALFAVFAAALSPQPVWIHAPTDLRYYMAALPLLLVMKALFVEWSWRHSKVVGGGALAVLLLTSAGAWPFNMRHLLTGEPTLGLHLVQFVREVHRPYRDSIRAVSDYLSEHAEQDDLVYVPGFANREALTYTLGHRLLFCCVLDEHTPLPADRIDSLGAHLAVRDTLPDWIVLFEDPKEAYWETVAGRYEIAAQADVFPYPTQRPEINVHAFEPLPAGKHGVRILKRSSADRLHAAADQLRKQGRYEDAVAAFREALAADPAYAPAHAGLGDALFRLQRHSEALAALTKAVDLQPNLPFAAVVYGLMGHAALELGRTAEAGSHYERALQIDPRDPQALDRLAMIRFNNQEYAAALELYDRMIEVSVESAQTHVNRGAALYYLERVDEAIASIEHALAVDPSLQTARSALEQLRSVQDRREQ